MAKQVQFRRGTTSQHSTFTGAAGEITVDTDKDTAVVHDGSTAGGVPLAKSSELANKVENLSDLGITATATELNYVDGVTSDIQTQLDAKGTVSTLSDLSVTASSTELNYVDGVTSAIQTQLNAKLDKSGGTMTGNLTLNADPTTALGAASKGYVDTIAAAGIHYHDPVRVEHPSNLNATYNNGTAGVGATLTNAGTNAALVLDDVSMVLNDRVLVANQTDQTQNGVYTVTTVGDGSTAWVLTRSTDTDSAGPSDPNAFGKGDAFFIKEGTTNAGHLDVLTTAGTIVFGTTNIVFAEVAETAVYTAGTDITLDGTTFNLNSTIAADTTGNAATATAWETARSITLTGDVTGTATGVDGSGNVSITTTVTSPYADSDVDTHLNTGTAASGEYLSWNGSDYDWATVPAGYADSDVDTHLNTGTASNGQYLSWNGSDYDWATVSTTVGIDDLTDGYNVGDSVGLGTDALANDDGSSNYNTAVGQNALKTVSTGTSNTAIGAFAGNSATGDYNTFSGNASGYNTTGDENVAVGSIALQVNTSGNQNTAVGREAINQNTTGNGSTGLGYRALYGDGQTAHSYNTGVGWRSGLNITTGTYNSFLGASTAVRNSSGTKNTAVGNEALYNNTTGQQNVAIGFNALKGTASSAHIYNTAVGAQAGESISTGGQNTFVGFDAGSNVTTGGSNIVIGGGSEATSATVSNEITLGSTGITRFRIPGAGIDNTKSSLSGTSVSVNWSDRDTYTHSLSGTTTYSFNNFPSSGQVCSITLIITGNGSSINWPSSVDWKGGTAPTAPASGETDIFVFTTWNSGSTVYGFQAGEAMG